VQPFMNEPVQLFCVSRMLVALNKRTMHLDAQLESTDSRGKVSANLLNTDKGRCFVLDY
jgi:hypothetical protein